jgi:hypothetical protein
MAIGTATNSKRLAVLLFKTLLYLSVFIFLIYVSTVAIAATTGMTRTLLTVTVVLAVGFTLRVLLTAYRVFVVCSICELMFISFAFQFNKKNRQFPLYQMTPGSIDVSKPFSMTLFKNFFWQGMRKRFIFNDAYFEWHWNPVRVVSTIRPVSKKPAGTVDLSDIEFVLSPTASSRDLYGMGFPMFKLINEHALNHNTPRSDWIFCVDKTKGIGARRKGSDYDN